MNKLSKIIVIGLLLLLVGVGVYFIVNQKEVSFNNVQINYNGNSVINNTDYEYYDTLIYIGLEQLGIDSVSVIINPLSEEAKQNFREQGGDLTAHLREYKGIYYLFISEVSKTESILVISHELIHLKQYLTKQLTYENNLLTWEGEEFNLKEVSYNTRPWELDAYEKQNELSDKISNFLLK